MWQVRFHSLPVANINRYVVVCLYTLKTRSLASWLATLPPSSHFNFCLRVVDINILSGPVLSLDRVLGVDLLSLVLSNMSVAEASNLQHK